MPKKFKKKRISPVTVEVVPSEETHEAPIETSPPVVEQESPIIQSSAPVAIKEKSKFSFGFFIVVMMVALFVALFMGALYVYFTGVTQIVSPSPTPQVSPTPIPEISFDASPTPAGTGKPTAAPKIADIKISVLNGSGKIGEAGKVKAALEKAGFKVTQTGNANSFDFTDTLIQVKSTVSSEVVTKLKDALKSTYSVKDGDNLDSKNTFDVIVTVGAK